MLPRRPLPRYRASLRWARRAAVASAFLVAGCGSSSNPSSSTGGSAGVGGSGTGGSAGAGGAGTGGSGAGGSAGTAGAGGSAGSAACTPAANYPAGPYGEAVGDTIADWHWKGYVNETAQGLANTHPYVNDYSMDDLRKSGRGYALVHLSEDF
jgi:hypothetical protein